MKQKILQMMFAVLVCAGARAQVNSGSNGSDGAFDPATNTVINMADHPNGIYQYTSVTISNGVTVTFIPNTANTPVVWLVQSNCVINGTVTLDGGGGIGAQGGIGGVGGFSGGNGGGGGAPAGDGQGPGGGLAGFVNSELGGNASFATNGAVLTNYNGACGFNPNQPVAGQQYGNYLLVPLIGGSGGGGTAGSGTRGGGGGGGAILIAANQFVEINGWLSCVGGSPGYYGGGGSGGAIRIVSQEIRGYGQLDVSGGRAYFSCGQGYDNISPASPGFIRFDSFVYLFSGSASGVVTRGYQPIIIPQTNQIGSLTIQSVAGILVPANPSGQIVSPDTVISGQQTNPIPVVVHCSNLPLNTLITLTVTPANGSSVRAIGYNTAGTGASSTATISIAMPRGGGIIYATAATGN